MENEDFKWKKNVVYNIGAPFNTSISL